MRTRRWVCGAFFAVSVGALIAVGTLVAAHLALSPSFASAPSEMDAPNEEPITPIPMTEPADPQKVALGQRLFEDPRLSRDNKRNCASCHDIRTNGASANGHDATSEGAPITLNTPSVFNATNNFRFNWAGTFRTLEAQAGASIESPQIMNQSIAEVVGKLGADQGLKQQFETVYGHGPDAESLLDAIARFEQSLTTPNSRFDRWLSGDTSALSEGELKGYRLFKSMGCVSCHQGANIGGNLFERHGIFHPLASPEPAILRVPSLRNIATTPPYFHDGSAPTLEEAVRRMSYAQLDTSLSQEQVNSIVSFLRTLTGTYQGKTVRAQQ